MRAKYGDFTMKVSLPYPVWITITFGEAELKINHHELCDLEHLVKQAKKIARSELQESQKDEV